MLSPRFNQERFRPPLGFSDVAIQAPAERAVPATGRFKLTHDRQEFDNVIRTNSIFDGDQHGPVVSAWLKCHDGCWPVKGRREVRTLSSRESIAQGSR